MGKRCNSWIRWIQQRISIRQALPLALSAGAAVLVFCGSLGEVRAGDVPERDLLKELKVFTDVLSVVQRDYVRPVDNRAIVEGAIKGMLATLDPHSGYLDPDFYQDLQVQTRGEFGGLGIEISAKEGLLVVVAPMEGSPAERAGVRAGDSIIKIEGRFAKELSLVDAVKQLRGPRGSEVTISVLRKGEPELIDIVVVRDVIQVRSVRSRYLADGVGYVRVSQFMEKTFDDLRQGLRRMKQQAGGSIKGLIVDLRNNPGGLLNQAVKISDLFLNDGLIVYTDGRIDGQKQKFFAHSRDTEPEYPIVVLVNGGSASASEIVAAALKEHGRALILGTKTFGKGSVQTITPLENGGALTLTTALYYTKSGASIQATGVVPDIEVRAPSDQLDEAAAVRLPSVREADLPGAIENPTDDHRDDGALRRINKTPTVAEPPIDPEKVEISDWTSRDPQFAKALDLLKSFSILRGAAPGASAATL